MGHDDLLIGKPTARVSTAQCAAIRWNDGSISAARTGLNLAQIRAFFRVVSQNAAYAPRLLSNRDLDEGFLGFLQCFIGFVVLREIVSFECSIHSSLGLGELCKLYSYLVLKDLFSKSIHNTNANMRIMNTSGGVTVPFLRSEGQAKIMAKLLLSPNDEMSISQLMEASGLSQPQVSRECTRLVESGILRQRHVGNMRLIRANSDSPYFRPLTQILDHAYGPLSVIRENFLSVGGVKNLFIFGSFAARHSGISGVEPNDIDVLIVGSPTGRNLRRANGVVERHVNRQVQVTVVSEQEWNEAKDGHASGFLSDIQSKPMLDLSAERGE